MVELSPENLVSWLLFGQLLTQDGFVSIQGLELSVFAIYLVLQCFNLNEWLLKFIFLFSQQQLILLQKLLQFAAFYLLCLELCVFKV